MSKKRRTALNLPGRHSPGSADAMRSMIRLALSVRGPEGEFEGRIRSALDAFSQMTRFDVWLVGTLDLPLQSASPAPAILDRLLAGGTEKEWVTSTRNRWTRKLTRDVEAVQLLFSMAANAPRPEPPIRLWRDSVERALVSIWISPPIKASALRQATWISLHRLGASATPFQLRERRWLTLLHEQCAAVLRPIKLN